MCYDLAIEFKKMIWALQDKEISFCIFLQYLKSLNFVIAEKLMGCCGYKLSSNYEITLDGKVIPENEFWVKNIPSTKFLLKELYTVLFVRTP